MPLLVRVAFLWDRRAGACEGAVVRALSLAIALVGAAPIRADNCEGRFRPRSGESGWWAVTGEADDAAVVHTLDGEEVAFLPSDEPLTSAERPIEIVVIVAEGGSPPGAETHRVLELIDEDGRTLARADQLDPLVANPFLRWPLAEGLEVGQRILLFPVSIGDRPHALRVDGNRVVELEP